MRYSSINYSQECNGDCTPGTGQLTSIEFVYKSRAFVEKAHGQAMQLFDRVQDSGPKRTCPPMMLAYGGKADA